MPYNHEIHHRRSIRLKHYDYSQAGAYFVTICAQDRQCLFGDIVDDDMRVNEAGAAVSMAWNDLPNHYENTALDKFVVMPNHVHGIIMVGAIHELPLRESINQTRNARRNMTLPKIIGRLKMTTAKRINELRHTPGIPVWQRNYYEHIIRDDDDLNRIREYITNNPARWAEDAENPSRP